VPNGSGGMVLVALGHTREAQGSPPAPSGQWTVSVTNTCEWPLTIDAWIERRDIPGELRGSRPQYGFVRDGSLTSGQGGLGTLANGRRTIVVGALDPKKFDKDPDRVSDYSSNGLDCTPGDCNPRGVRRLRPDVYCTGERLASGFFSGSSRSLAGTSIAAAQVTAAIAAAQGNSSGNINALDALAKQANSSQKAARPRGARSPAASAPLAGQTVKRPMFVLTSQPEESRDAFREIPKTGKWKIGPGDSLDTYTPPR